MHNAPSARASAWASASQVFKDESIPFVLQKYTRRDRCNELLAKLGLKRILSRIAGPIFWNGQYNAPVKILKP